ncbi:MAG: acyl--CoA ligase, partial [Gemmatimonadetes bacterium]|nr:acyl--CoA ligase [Gemmatimonadota bacterium]
MFSVEALVQTIVSRIEHAAKGSGSITFVTGPEPLTRSWADLHEDAKAVSAALQQRGIEHGDRVALLGPTTPELVTALQAVWLCGATLVVLPLPMRLGSIEEFTTATRARIEMAACAAVLVDPQFLPFIETAPGDAPLYPLSDVMPGPGRPTANDFIRPDYSAEDLFVLQFTS